MFKLSDNQQVPELPIRVQNVGGYLGWMAKHCMKNTKSKFWGQTSVGDMSGDKRIFWIMGEDPSSLANKRNSGYGYVGKNLKPMGPNISSP